MFKKIIEFFKKLFGKKEVVVEKGTTIVIPNGLTEKGEKEVETITLEETVVVPAEKKTKKTTKKNTKTFWSSPNLCAHLILIDQISACAFGEAEQVDRP